MRLNKRSNEPEWMDLGSKYYTPEEFVECHYQLDKIGEFLGGDRATFSAFNNLPSPPRSILDVGCGGGLFALKLSKLYPTAKIMGIDISQEAIEFANRAREKSGISREQISFVYQEKPHLLFDEGAFDVVTATLVCHHMLDEEIVEFLKSAFRVARKAVIINDLRRHWLALAGFAVIAPLFFRNRLILHDGPISIKKGFTRRDWEHYFEAASIPQTKVTISQHSGFRWIVMVIPHNTDLPCKIA